MWALSDSPPAPLAGSRGSAHPETEAVVSRTRGGRGGERPYPCADPPHQVGESAAETSAPQVARIVRPAHPVRGGRARAAMRAARRGDPAIHAQARKDHPRRVPTGQARGLKAPGSGTVEGRDDNRRTMRLDVKHDFLEPVWMALQVPQSAPDLKASGRCRPSDASGGHHALHVPDPKDHSCHTRIFS